MSKLQYKGEDVSIITKRGVVKNSDIKTKDISDSYHSFAELYFHRMILTLSLAKQLPDGMVVKSKLHDDGTMFEGSFIVCFNTHQGFYSYHYDLEFWDLFSCIPTVEKAPVYDGHTPGDVVRLLSYTKN